MKTEPVETDLLNQIDLDRLPRHIAIIMDGNGRWAKRRRLPRIAGHRAGISAVRQAVEACARLGVPYLTLYAFSVENWKRPHTEIKLLMSLLREYLKKEIGELNRQNIRLGGHREDSGTAQAGAPGLAECARPDPAEYRNAPDPGAELWGAGGIGGCRAANCLPKRSNGSINVDEALLSEHLYTRGLPDPDLLIRTSGELRLSNFLLWQVAYAELWVTETLWPDFTQKDLFQAIIDFQKRERRYGGLGMS